MRHVIKIKEEKKELKPIQITHMQDDGTHGWGVTNYIPPESDEIIYIGHCRTDGDLFAIKDNGNITIAKGHLNDGVYGKLD